MGFHEIFLYVCMSCGVYYVVLFLLEIERIEPRAWWMLGKDSTLSCIPSPL